MKRLSLLFGFVMLISSILFIINLAPPKVEHDAVTIYDINHNVLTDVYPDGYRQTVPLEKIHPTLVDAVYLIEDQHFYTHHGFDFGRIARAFLTNLKARELKEGASTITQQLARHLYLSHDRTWGRKLQEALHAYRIERHFEKEDILEGYLNTIYYGHGIYGVEAASQFYFGKTTTELNLAEIAMLVMIPKRPNSYSPIHNLPLAKQEQARVLTRLTDHGLINEQDAYLAKREAITVYGEHPEDDSIGYVKNAVMREVKTVLNKPLKKGAIHTTIDLTEQRALKEAAFSHRGNLEVGAIMAHPSTGAISALIGGSSYHTTPFNRAYDAYRMTGSAFKPFVYYTALEHGYHPASRLKIAPTVFQTIDGGDYAPRNHHDQYPLDFVTMQQALAVSDNIYPVKLSEHLPEDSVSNTARSVGVTTSLEEGPTLALGTSALSVLDLTTAYSHFANGGHHVELYTIQNVTSADGDLLYTRPDFDRAQVLDPINTFIMNQMMTGMFDENLSDYLPVTGAGIQDTLTHHYAGKSGSTTYDRWMVGYSPNRILSVWCGDDDHKPIESDQVAQLIWRDAIESVHTSRPHQAFEAPPEVKAVYIDLKTGQIAKKDADTARLMYFHRDHFR
ncbi:Membrane carboxypeptidase (penicillin-binding protein) [Pelagirhabdus alkalitolerans]|uniref:Membrane carboxypeptidase (Penicillin-binding protein) n=1 Tax=Pelagirhabdus alkalitolerans TaxID=1612202 RepID=A0A1G6GKC4_9BACI|nr:transglycosylase domain-containing protein [Pelagirhabdus alkalitolerans]SDB81626.1 Membrane carboxypeptidase (penicillin-binding protein) [Pelagirhabdus alkalitolerans]